jgi:hypothetical protein
MSASSLHYAKTMTIFIFFQELLIFFSFFKGNLL